MPLRVSHGDCDGWTLCRQRKTVVYKIIDDDGAFRTLCRDCWPVYRLGPLPEEPGH